MSITYATRRSGSTADALALIVFLVAFLLMPQIARSADDDPSNPQTTTMADRLIKIYVDCVSQTGNGPDCRQLARDAYDTSDGTVRGMLQQYYILAYQHNIATLAEQQLLRELPIFLNAYADALDYFASTIDGTVCRLLVARVPFEKVLPKSIANKIQAKKIVTVSGKIQIGELTWASELCKGVHRGLVTLFDINGVERREVCIRTDKYDQLLCRLASSRVDMTGYKTLRVRRAYQEIAGRTPGAGESGYWTQFPCWLPQQRDVMYSLAVGLTREDGFQRALFATPRYWKDVGIERLYRGLFSRVPDASELRYWRTQVRTAADFGHIIYSAAQPGGELDMQTIEGCFEN